MADAESRQQCPGVLPLLDGAVGHGEGGAHSHYGNGSEWSSGC